MNLEPQVLVIGGGVTGTGIARDLALRGIPSLLVEKRDINAGASGSNHGLLHSGARYVASDREAAMECHEEGEILRKIAPQCIEDTGGFFVGVEGDDENYIADFPGMCERSNIPYVPVDLHEARSLEPVLSEKLISAYRVMDGAIDPFMLSLDNISQAIDLGSEASRNTKTIAITKDKGKIFSVEFFDKDSCRNIKVYPRLVINAAGAWANLIAEMAGAKIHILYSSGTLLVTQNRLAKRVLNRMRKAADADILVPGGTVSVLGTTSVTISQPDNSRPSISETNRIIDDASKMIPVLDSVRYIRAYSGVRPLVFSGDPSDGRSVSRGFSLIDHANEGIDNFITITGGKLSTYRLMAEKTADLVCDKLGVSAECTTKTVPLPRSGMGKWTEPGRAPRKFADYPTKKTDVMLCECELVSSKIVDSIVDSLGDMRGRSMLNAIGRRSRVGKGPCQGGFCELRITSHLYDRHFLDAHRGTDELKSFIERRWKGFYPVSWGTSAVHPGTDGRGHALRYPQSGTPQLKT